MNYSQISYMPLLTIRCSDGEFLLFRWINLVLEFGGVQKGRFALQGRTDPSGVSP
jgi:hypothetical protein